MFKEIKYDIELKKGSKKGKYTPEYEALHEFNGGDNTNMVFTYDNKEAAHNAYAACKRYIADARIPLCCRVFNSVNVLIERCE